MPQILDAFVTTLTLDPSGYEKGQADAARSIKKTREGALSAGKEIEAAGKRAASFFSSLKTQVVGTLLAFAGTSGIASFLTDITKANAGIGRLSANLDIAPVKLAAWQAAFATVSGTAAEADGALRGLASAYQNYKLTGVLENANEFRLLGIKNVEDLRDPAEAMLTIAENRNGLSRPELANVLTRMGFTDAGIALLTQGREKLAQLIAEQEKLNPITEENIKAAQDFEKALAELKTTLVGLTQGPLTDFIRGLTDLLNLLRGEKDKPLPTKPRREPKWYELFWTEGADETARRGARASGGRRDTRGGITIPLDDAPVPQRVNGRRDRVSGSQLQQRRTAYANLFRAHGWSETAVQGIMAGMEAENGTLGPNVKNPTSTAYGLGQWMTARQRDYSKWAKRNGRPANIRNSSASDQIAFMSWELRNSEAKWGRKIAGSQSAEEALNWYVGGDEWGFMRPGPGRGGDMRRGRRVLGIAQPAVRSAGRAAPGYRGGGNSTATNTTSIGTINVHTASTDGKGIARDLPGAIKRRGLTTQANRGMQ